MPDARKDGFKLPFKKMYPEEFSIAERPGRMDAVYVCRLPSGYIGHIWGSRMEHLCVCVAKDTGDTLKKQAHECSHTVIENKWKESTNGGPLFAIALLRELEKQRVEEQGPQGSAHTEVPAADRHQQEEAGIEARLSEAP